MGIGKTKTGPDPSERSTERPSEMQRRSGSAKYARLNEGSTINDGQSNVEHRKPERKPDFYPGQFQSWRDGDERFGCGVPWKAIGMAFFTLRFRNIPLGSWTLDSHGSRRKRQ